MKFQFNLYTVGDRALEQVMADVEVDTLTHKVTSIEYEDKDARNYVEGLGAKGTADHWLNEAKEMLEQEHKDPNTGEIWYEYEEYLLCNLFK